MSHTTKEYRRKDSLRRKIGYTITKNMNNDQIDLIIQSMVPGDGKPRKVK